MATGWTTGRLKPLGRSVGRKAACCLAGFGLAVVLFVAGFFLGGGFSGLPLPEPRPTMLISDTIIEEPEERLLEVVMDAEIPRLDVQMDVALDIDPPPLQIQYTINPRLDIGVAVPALPSLGTGDTVFGVHQLETQPRAVHAPPPAYPQRAQQLKRSGTVRVRVVLDKEGGIVSTRLVPGEHVELFGDATLAAIRKWRFSPGKIGDRPVMCEVEIPIEFTLNR